MKHLAFGPGAMGYFMYLGALSALSDASALNELVSISGASAGALLGLVYILAKGDMQKSLQYSLAAPIKTVMKPNIKVLLKSYGLVSTKKVRSVFEDTARTFIGKDDVTFAELYAHWPVMLHVAACCIDLHATHYFSVDTAPSMSSMPCACPYRSRFCFRACKSDRGVTLTVEHSRRFRVAHSSARIQKPCLHSASAMNGNLT